VKQYIDAPPTYKAIQQIEATSCRSKLWDPPATNEDAIDQLRFKASRLGANGIAEVFCDSGGEFDLGKNCWSSVKCRGTAIEVPRAYVHPATNLSFPPQLGAFHRTLVRQYPDPRIGVQISYTLRDFAKADLFIYDLGLTKIPTGIESDEVKEAFSQAENELRQFASVPPYKNPQRSMVATPTIEHRGRKSKLLVTMYTLTAEREDGSNLTLASWIILTGYKNKFLKLRYTHPFAQYDQGLKELRDLVLGFVEANPNETQYFFIPK
jgi:hypothetical protein